MFLRTVLLRRSKRHCYLPTTLRRLFAHFVPISIAPFLDKTKPNHERQLLLDQQMKESRQLINLTQFVDLSFQASKTDLTIDFNIFAEELLARSQELITLQDVGKSLAMVTVAKQSWKSAGALKLVSALVSKVQTCPDEAVSDIVIALHGMKHIRSDHREVLQLIAAFIPKVQTCSETFTANHVAMALKGLQSLSSDHPEVLQLIAALIPKVQSCSEMFTARDVGSLSAEGTVLSGN
eukprot:gene35663-47950_t